MENIKNNGTSKYNIKKKILNYDKLSESIDDVKDKLQKTIDEYSKAYKEVNKTIEPNDDPFTKKLKKAKEFKNKIGDGISKLKKTEMTNIPPQKSTENKKND